MLKVVNVVDSLIAREVDCGCYLNAGRAGVASTKALHHNVLYCLMALWFSQLHNINEFKRKQYITDLRKLSMQVKCFTRNERNKNR